jgi:hypothetical protein
MRASSKRSILLLAVVLSTVAGCVDPSGPAPMPEETDGTSALVAPAILGDEELTATAMVEHGC